MASNYLWTEGNILLSPGGGGGGVGGPEKNLDNFVGIRKKMEIKF